MLDQLPLRRIRELMIFCIRFFLSSDTAGAMDSDIGLICVAPYVVGGQICGENSGVAGEG